MSRAVARRAAVSLSFLLLAACGPNRPPNPIDGARAYAHVKAMVEIGPRPSSSPELRKCRDYIVAQLKEIGLAPRIDSFESDKAPEYTFHNVEVEIPGTADDEKRLLVIGSHYDTKLSEGHPDPSHNLRFVGANDAASSSGLLIELARHFKAHPQRCSLLLIWFDGEESIPWEWGAGDRALFGSRRAVRKLRARFPKEKDLNQWVPVMMLLDMVGAKDLRITRDTSSSPELIDIVAESARDLAWDALFFEPGNVMEVTDDHIPFRDFGIRVIDIIQFGGQGSPISPWWHTEDDNLDIISADSLGIVGHVVAVAVPKIVERFYR